jgi:hypothetical protein
MPLSREEVLQLVHQIPDEIDIEELIYWLYLREQLAAAEANITASRTFAAEEVRERVPQGQL